MPARSVAARLILRPGWNFLRQRHCAPAGFVRSCLYFFSTPLDRSFLKIVLSTAPPDVQAVALGPPAGALRAACSMRYVISRLAADASWERAVSARAGQASLVKYDPDFPST